MGVHGPTHKCSWVLYYYFLPGNFLHDTLSSAFSRCVEIVDIVVGTSEQTVPSLSFLSTPALAQYLNIRHRWWWILRRFVASCWHDGCILLAWGLHHASMSEGDVSWQLAIRGSSHACMLAWGLNLLVSPGWHEAVLMPARGSLMLAWSYKTSEDSPPSVSDGKLLC